MAEEKKKFFINKRWVFEEAQRTDGPFRDCELEHYFKGYIQGVKDIVEPFGFEVVIGD